MRHRPRQSVHDRRARQRAGEAFLDHPHRRPWRRDPGLLAVSPSEGDGLAGRGRHLAKRARPCCGTTRTSTRSWSRSANISKRTTGATTSIAARTASTRWCSLQEATEGALLKMPGRPTISGPDRPPAAVQSQLCRVPASRSRRAVRAQPQRFYATLDEKADALRFKARLGKKLVVWALSGSAQHKIWPGLSRGLNRVLAMRATRISSASAARRTASSARAVIGYGGEYHPAFESASPSRSATATSARRWRWPKSPMSWSALRPRCSTPSRWSRTQGDPALAFDGREPDPRLGQHRQHRARSQAPRPVLALPPDALRHQPLPARPTSQLAACATSIGVERVVQPILAALRGTTPAAAA
jgi:hypothetical protein